MKMKTTKLWVSCVSAILVGSLLVAGGTNNTSENIDATPTPTTVTESASVQETIELVNSVEVTKIEEPIPTPITEVDKATPVKLIVNDVEYNISTIDINISKHPAYYNIDDATMYGTGIIKTKDKSFYEIISAINDLELNYNLLKQKNVDLHYFGRTYEEFGLLEDLSTEYMHIVMEDDTSRFLGSLFIINNENITEEEQIVWDNIMDICLKYNEIKAITMGFPTGDGEGSSEELAELNASINSPNNVVVALEDFPGFYYFP